MTTNTNDNIKTLTRADLAEAVYREVGFSFSDSSQWVDDVLKEITDCLEEGNDLKLSGFGSFKVKEKKEREGRNPKTKKPAKISARCVVTFHASNMLKQRINDAQQNTTKSSAKVSGNAIDSKLKSSSKVS